MTLALTSYVDLNVGLLTKNHSSSLKRVAMSSLLVGIRSRPYTFSKSFVYRRSF